MEALRGLAESLGLSNPTTYIQSGNLVFDADDDTTRLTRLLESALEQRFGFEIPVVTRTGAELEEVARSHPFTSLGLDERYLMVAFLDREPEVDIGDVLDAEDLQPDRFELSGREVYLAYPNGSGRSRLTHDLLQRRLAVTATIRNRRTILRLLELSRPNSRI
jgi:uncharacterized protein (DUF1697 family)